MMGNPYAEQESKLKALEDEIAQAEASLENDFSKFASEELEKSERLQELFFDNKQEFIKSILKLQNDFLKDLQGKVEKANALRGELGQQKAMDSISEAAEEFDKMNLGVSSDELLDFFSEDLPKREKTPLENLKPSEFFKALFEKYTAYQNGTQKTQNKETFKNEELPRRLNGGGASVENEGEELLTQRF